MASRLDARPDPVDSTGPARASGEQPRRPGTVYTFYSYKGGVGRSMAVANVAALLAKWGHKVLVLDWDLEAPGIEKYFERAPSSVEGSRSTTPGVLDLLTARAKGDSLDWRDCLLHAHPYEHGAPVAIISAGREGDSYVPDLQSLDWDALFDQHDLGGYLDDLRHEWAEEYEFVLVDSRTGINDIGGICTILLPDVIVLLFTTNEQSANGALNIGLSAQAARGRLPTERSRLVVIPVPSRDESRSEYDDAQAWRKRFAVDFAPLFQDWLPRGTTISRVLSKLYIPYWAKWSFGERLPVVEAPEEIEDPAKISSAYAKLATLVATDMDWAAVEGESFQTRKEAEAEAERKRLEEERRLRLLKRWGIAAAAVLVLALGFGGPRLTGWLQERSADFDAFEAIAASPPLPIAWWSSVADLELSERQFAEVSYALEDLAARGRVTPERALSLREEVRRTFAAQRGLPLLEGAEDPLNPLIVLRGGTFEMGADSADGGAPDERPVRRVSVATFQIQQHEVTNAEYERFDPTHRRDADCAGDDDEPVACVDWYGAMAYAAWLGGTLPTEAQWEYAARGASGRTYPWGDDEPTCERAHYGGCSGAGSSGYTAPVMLRPAGATPERVHDLAGNVWEWVSDWYGLYLPGDTIDPRGPESGSSRVLRGGSFLDAPDYLRGAARVLDVPDYDYDFRGFRVAWPGGQD